MLPLTACATLLQLVVWLPQRRGTSLQQCRGTAALAHAQRCLSIAVLCKGCCNAQPAAPHKAAAAAAADAAHLQFDVTFPRMPCAWLSVDAMDISGEVQLEVRLLALSWSLCVLWWFAKYPWLERGCHDNGGEPQGNLSVILGHTTASCLSAGGSRCLQAAASIGWHAAGRRCACWSALPHKLSGGSSSKLLCMA